MKKGTSVFYLTRNGDENKQAALWCYPPVYDEALQRWVDPVAMSGDTSRVDNMLYFPEDIQLDWLSPGSCATFSKHRLLELFKQNMTV